MDFFRLLSALCCFLIVLPAFAQPEKRNPSFEEVISLRDPGNPEISPDGRHVAFTVGTTDWENNHFDTEIWLSRDGGEPFQLTRTEEGSSTAPQWSPDGQWIAFQAKRGEHSQIHVIRAGGGEALPVTRVDRSIGSFRWSPDGMRIAFTMQRPQSETEKQKEKRYGEYEREDEEYRNSWLYVIAFDPDRRPPEELPCYNAEDSTAQSYDCLEWPKPETLIDSVDFTVTNFEWSPDGTSIAYRHQPDPLINSFFHADISVLDLESKTRRSLIQSPAPESLAGWSPDGQFLLFTRASADSTAVYYKNQHLYKIPAEGGSEVRLAADFDEQPYVVDWNEKGIFFAAIQKTETHLFHLDPNSGTIQRWAASAPRIAGASLTPDGQHIAFLGSDDNTLQELFISTVDNIRPKKLTDFTAQIAGWKTAHSEVIQWKSRDGATIEGVLHKPQDYDPSKKYPLLVRIHGGPTGVDQPTPVPAYVYPAVQWLNKGALVLRVNYRGSAGYGEAFRSLNVRNLGVGDAWDVLSGIDHLAAQGLIDTTLMGCMGWSQGGYISAFLTTTSDRFKAISVGAGISDWVTYYVNTDIHPFTRQYLKATPWEDEAVYEKTSPMTYINQASTPTLIQHGENDRRVPIPNAYKLYQGLQDQGVPTELIVYKGFGHGITRPKERLAAMWHNWQWFNKYLWGEEVEMPTGKE